MKALHASAPEEHWPGGHGAAGGEHLRADRRRGAAGDAAHGSAGDSSIFAVLCES